MGYIADSDIIHCYIDLSDYGNNTFLDRFHIHTELAKEATKIFRRYGLKFKIEPLGDKGGGVSFSLLGEIIKTIYGELGTIISILTILPIIFRKKFNHFVLNNSPRVDISLSISSDDEYPANEMYPTGNWMGRKLINLKLISDHICKTVEEKYPIIKIDQGFGLSLPKIPFWIHYKISSEHQNKFNSFRLLRLFKSLNIKKGFYSNYEFRKWFLILREDGGLKVENEFRMRKPLKKYYLFLSSYLFQDYIWTLLKMRSHRNAIAGD